MKSLQSEPPFPSGVFCSTLTYLIIPSISAVSYWPQFLRDENPFEKVLSCVDDTEL